MTYTPGPWRWIEHPSPADSQMAKLVGAGDVEVCNFGFAESYYPVEGTEPSIEDKALIAAAPLGYALAEAIVALESSPMQRDYVSPGIQTLAREFLAKAGGRPA